MGFNLEFILAKLENFSVFIGVKNEQLRPQNQKNFPKFVGVFLFYFYSFFSFILSGYL